MTDADRLRRLLTSAGLSQMAAARALGLAPTTIRRYVSGRLPVPQVVWLALETVTRRP